MPISSESALQCLEKEYIKIKFKGDIKMGFMDAFNKKADEEVAESTLVDYAETSKGGNREEAKSM